MKGYRVHITLLEPTMIGSGPATGNHVDSLRYIPGGTVRGALAQRWIIANGTPDSVDAALAHEFAAIFESGISFGPAHPTGSRIRGLSELHLKYRRDQSQPTVIDRATDPAPDTALDYEYGKGEIDGVTVIDVARTALDASERASDGQLYSREALPPGLVLTGTIGGQHPWLDALCSTEIKVRLGGRRSVNGRATLTIEPTTFAERVATNDVIVIRAVSPVILIDDACRALVDFSPSALAGALGCSPDEITIHQTWVRTEIVHGWHAATGLPKPDDLALAVGSTAVITVPSGVDLQQLEHLGIGARTAEGFGRCVVDPSSYSSDTANTATGATSVAPCLRALTQIREHWFNVGPKRARDLLRDALAKRTVGDTASIGEILGRSKGEVVPQQYHFEFDDLVNRLSPSDLDDLIALVDAETIDRGNRV